MLPEFRNEIDFEFTCITYLWKIPAKEDLHIFVPGLYQDYRRLDSTETSARRSPVHLLYSRPSVNRASDVLSALTRPAQEKVWWEEELAPLSLSLGSGRVLPLERTM